MPLSGTVVERLLVVVFLLIAGTNCRGKNNRVKKVAVKIQAFDIPISKAGISDMVSPQRLDLQLC